MHFEDFAAGGSFLHRMHPGLKIIALALFAAVVAVGTSAAPLAAALAFSVLLAGLAEVSLRKVLQRLVVVQSALAALTSSRPTESMTIS